MSNGMSLHSSQHRLWDVSAVLEALGGAEAALWTWEPDEDRMRFSGATKALGLGPLAPECSSTALRALVMPHERAMAEDLMRQQEPGTPLGVRMTMRGGQSCLWRGVWLDDGVRAAGVVALEARFAPSDMDALTGLLARRSFLAAVRERLQRPVRHTLITADLDRLSRLNDALGHERADLVLAALGSRLAAAFTSDAVMGRVGEDEFALLVETAQAPNAGDLLRAALEKPLRIAGFDIHPTLSIGGVTAEGGADAPEAAELLRRAELAVEAARTAGPGGAAAYGRTLESDGLSRLALESDLRGAIARGEIGPYYQPVVRLVDGALYGFEALARWRHPRRGIIPPDDFLPLIEEMGLMNDLGRCMLRAASAQIAAWRRRHPAAGALSVAVNLSAGEIERPDLIADVTGFMAEHSLPRGALRLEVTESDIMRDPDKAGAVLSALRQAGAGLSVDDFGTGHSALSYLSRLPFDTLKIDRYFVKTLTTHEASAKIVRSVVGLGRELSLQVVAEGVESAGLAQRLLELGCDYGQGFGYAPALSPSEAEVYLNEAYADGTAPLRKHA
jgi:c-di-GMP-specific phosphodiesterase